MFEAEMVSEERSEKDIYNGRTEIIGWINRGSVKGRQYVVRWRCLIVPL